MKKGKTKIMKINGKKNSPVAVQGKVLDEAQSFMYIGSIVNTNGGKYSYVRTMIGKARISFHLA